MAGNLKSPAAVVLTPHKITLCHLIQCFSSSPPPPPTPPDAPSASTRLGLLLFSLTKACDDFLEPTLDELISHLKAACGEEGGELCGDLMECLLHFSSPDDLFNFFMKLRSVLALPEMGGGEEDQFHLEPMSHLGMYVRRCILAFNLLSFEGVCHLLTSLGTYSTSNADYASGEDDFHNGSEFSENEDMNFDAAMFEKNESEYETGTSAGESTLFHLSVPRPLHRLVKEIQVPVDKLKCNDFSQQSTEFLSPLNDTLVGDYHQGEIFLRTNWQVQGYLREQADLIEKHGSSFPLNVFEAILNQLGKLAPELHRIHYLRYMNNLYHEDYLVALDNLHCYFDYDTFVGRFEAAVLCLGIMHSHFGHFRQALEALTEAVRISQQNKDTSCLSQTVAAICELLSEIGISNTTGIFGLPYSLGTNTGMGTSLSTQQQLLVLLKRLFKDAERVDERYLGAFCRLALAKFNLKHVVRSLLSFGPKASTKLKTCPTSVCKELRLSPYLLGDPVYRMLQIVDGAFSSAWLKNLQNPKTSSILSHSNDSGCDHDVFHFASQPSTIPGFSLQLAGASFLLRATSWELYGSAPLARVNALIHASCYADAASSEDLSLAYVKLIQHLAVSKGYKEAFIALKLAEEKFFCFSKSRIQILKLQLLHEHALHRGHLKLAQQVCDELGVLGSSIMGVDMDLKTETSLRHARTLLAANQFSQAATVANSLFCTCYKFNKQVENASVLLLLAEIYKKSGNAVMGLPYALASLSFCQSFNLDLLEASATLTLAELWLSLGPNHTKRALSLVHRTLPMILGHGGLELCARANIAVAKCYLSDHGFSVSEDPNSVLDPLRQAVDDLQPLEYNELSAEAFYLMAIVYNKLGMMEEREDAASSFKKHIEALEHPQGVDDPLVQGL
ncbi:Anaphase-promoting complex subunit 5 [Acorus gramineus]|uniref:Anaphase-promoting complex subunit 5 n=1 Tax=Acorus gramineus TaxID=55184 RepID=A0AAV9BMW6_ACOGR|nr:Anaphase-promoting complex subunit 5 [Acorus gramineus]